MTSEIRTPNSETGKSAGNRQETCGLCGISCHALKNTGEGCVRVSQRDSFRDCLKTIKIFHMFDTCSRLIHRNAHFPGPLALMYHSTPSRQSTNQWPWSISIETFRRHLSLLHAEGWSTVTLSDLLSKQTLPVRTVAITFDDGYVDNLKAVEALVEHGMVASWFVVTRCLGARACWQDPDMPELSLLTTTHLREMQKQGMEIGSHSMNHSRLPQLDDSALLDELTASKTLLEDQLGISVGSLAYPYGQFDERVVLAAKRAGYVRACTTQSGWALLDHDPFRVRRLTVYNGDSPGVLARKMAYAANDVTWSSLSRLHLTRLRHRFLKS